MRTGLLRFVNVALLGALVVGGQIATAQGGGADFTRVISSRRVDGHWLVRLDARAGAFTGDFTHTEVYAMIRGQRTLLTPQQSFRFVHPRVTLRIVRGESNGRVTIIRTADIVNR